VVVKEGTCCADAREIWLGLIWDVCDGGAMGVEKHVVSGSDSIRLAVRAALDYFYAEMREYFRDHERINMIEIKSRRVEAREDGASDETRRVEAREDAAGAPGEAPEVCVGVSDVAQRVEVVVVMEESREPVEKYMDCVRRAVESQYVASEIVRTRPTVLLRTGSVLLEIMPGMRRNGISYVARDGKEWVAEYGF